jgi:hypothetical protein
VASILLLVLAGSVYIISQSTDPKAEAARGGGAGGKGRKPPQPTATVSLTSTNPVPASTAPTFYISGFASNETVITQMSTYLKQDWVSADSTGSLTYTFFEPLNVPGQYTFVVDKYGGGNKASTTFSVQ